MVGGPSSLLSSFLCSAFFCVFLRLANSGLRPRHVLCVTYPVTGPPGGAERRQGTQHKGGEEGALNVVPAGRGAPGEEERQAEG